METTPILYACCGATYKKRSDTPDFLTTKPISFAYAYVVDLERRKQYDPPGEKNILLRYSTFATVEDRNHDRMSVRGNQYRASTLGRDEQLSRMRTRMKDQIVELHHERTLLRSVSVPTREIEGKRSKLVKAAQKSSKPLHPRDVQRG